jgi:hypothetical protein
MDADKANTSDSLKVYEIYRDRIKHQDVLISHRMGYFSFMQAVIAAGLKADIWNADQLWLTDWRLPVMGWLLALALLVSISRAFHSIEMCVKLYGHIGKHQTSGLSGVSLVGLAPTSFGRVEGGAMPPLRSPIWTHILGHGIAWLVTLLALIFWPLFLVAPFPEAQCLLELIGLYLFATLFVAHVQECRRNDECGLNDVDFQPQANPSPSASG